MSATMRRFKKLIAAVKEFMIELDALGLKEKSAHTTKMIFNVQPRQYQFLTDANKLTAFNEWFREQVEAGVLSVDPGTRADQPWTTEFVDSAYKRGVVNSYVSSRQAGVFDQEGVGDITQEEFLRSSFAAPEAISKIQLLATRSFEGMRGVSATMSSDMSRILAQGLADGRGPADIAREMVARIGNLTENRALLIARTEIINAHAEGQLDSFKKLGIDKLGLKAEWSTAGDGRVCPLCAAREGQVFSVEDARGLIPLHPNCRCAWIPSEAKSSR